MTTLMERAQEPLGMQFYQEPNYAELVGRLAIIPTETSQYVLRCPILIPGAELAIPEELAWCTEFIETSFEYQKRSVGIEQPFAYLTVRHGKVISETDDELHVDGFSMKVPHVPEQNYIWTDHDPTEVIAFGLDVPKDFDPLRHNIQYLIQDSQPKDARAQNLEEETIYAMDPYVFHRRPQLAVNTVRTFLRLSMTPIAIDDTNNFINPRFGVITSKRDGVIDFRNKLERYPIAV